MIYLSIGKMERPHFSFLKNGLLLKNFDVHLQDFYRTVIGKEIDLEYEKYSPKIKDAWDEIILHYKKEYTEKPAIDLRFSTREKRCAYVLKHSPLFTSTVAFHFYEVVQRNQICVIKPFRERRLKLCCLGGGPASEVVAIAKVLGPLYSSTEDKKPLKLDVTIVDINEDWKTTCDYVIQCLKKDPTFEGLDLLSIDFSLIQADLTKPLKEDVRNAIEKADIITMVYFVSAVNGGKESDESLQMIQKIMELMKEGSVVFFMDNATDVHFQQMDRAAKETSDVDIIYEPCVEDLRFLTLKSVERFLEIYSGHFDLKHCMTHGFMSYCAWRKIPTYLCMEEGKERERQEKLKSQKNNERLTREMQQFRRELKLLKYTNKVDEISRMKSKKHLKTGDIELSLAPHEEIGKKLNNSLEENNRMESESPLDSVQRSKPVNVDEEEMKTSKETDESIGLKKTKRDSQENNNSNNKKDEADFQPNEAIKKEETESVTCEKSKKLTHAPKIPLNPKEKPRGRKKAET